jgi:hypothetical protein
MKTYETSEPMNSSAAARGSSTSMTPAAFARVK